MITLSGSPKTLHAGYNPAYFYANSTNVNEPNFRYLMDITNLSTGELLARLRIKPRYGDKLLEGNIQKILTSQLRYSGIDFIENGTETQSFMNTPSSGFKYGVSFGEEYPAEWPFDDTYYFNDYVGLLGSTLPPYSEGDFIQVNGAAEYIEFEDNFFDSGLVGFTFTTPHPFNVGDTVYILQDEPYTNASYQGYTTILSATSLTVTTAKPFILNSPVEGGTMIRNYEYDGLQQVSGVTTVGVDYLVVTYQPWIDNSPTNSGTTKYNDNRVIQVTGLTTATRYVFNGAQTPLQFLNWDSDDYDPLIDGQKFLTTMPRDIQYPCRLDNIGFINLWSREFESFFDNYELEVNTYDINNNLIGTWTDLNPNNITVGRTQIQAIPALPVTLNRIRWNVIENGDFDSVSGWTITNQLGGVATITGGTLNYLDTAGGNGTSLIVQENVLESGCTYQVELEASNNNFVLGEVGDENDTYTIFNDQNGIFTYTFTATGTDFYLILNSAGGVTQGVDIDNITVRRYCPIIDCDVDHYTVNVNEISGGTIVSQTELITFKVDCSCTGRYTNYPIIFLDRYGSVLPINFTLNSKSKVDINREMTKTFVGRLDTDFGGYKYNLAEHSMRPFYTELSEEWELQSDWMSESLMEYVEELFSSPYASISIDDKVYSVVIVDNTFERKRKNNVKNIRYTLTVQLSLSSGIQTG